jgi:hypothetical protein
MRTNTAPAKLNSVKLKFNEYVAFKNNHNIHSANCDNQLLNKEIKEIYNNED